MNSPLPSAASTRLPEAFEFYREVLQNPGMTDQTGQLTPADIAGLLDGALLMLDFAYPQGRADDHYPNVAAQLDALVAALPYALDQRWPAGWTSPVRHCHLRLLESFDRLLAAPGLNHDHDHDRTFAYDGVRQSLEGLQLMAGQA